MLKKNNMKILIYGFGRMGLTHFSILNGINPQIQFSVIEPNKILRKILKKNINAKFYADDSTLKDAFDITLITTPSVSTGNPCRLMFHSAIYSMTSASEVHFL